MIIDGHAHVFPRLGSAPPELAELQLRFLQHHVQYHPQGFRRAADGVRLSGSPIAPDGDGLDDMPAAEVRIGRHGRLEFRVDGEEYYLPWYPPSLDELEATPEALIAQMDYAGVDRAVIQHDHLYGRLDDYLPDVRRRFPRLAPLAQIDEWSDDLAGEAARLRRQLDDGCVGLYFCVEALAKLDFRRAFDDPCFEPVWALVTERGVPVFWYLYTSQRDRLGTYLEQVRRLDRWAQAHPEIPCIYTHGIESIVLRPRAERLRIPDEVFACCRRPNVHLEVMLHLMAPDTEYPYAWAMPIMERLHRELGPEKLIWGSDMPAALRSCTYRQSMDYVLRHAGFMTAADLDLFFGGNLARLLNIEEA
jgi:predicted TIM-barrel fold metal-dependent hydrolase